MSNFTDNVLVSFLLILFIRFQFVLTYNCSTPVEWLDVEADEFPENESHLLFDSRWPKWPNGQLIYKLISNLSASDLKHIHQAFEDYHKKTCIRFVPFKEGDVNYTVIEPDNSVCGSAKLCMQGGEQFVKFGDQCANKNTLVHELGHSLCLRHEHQRVDRNNYVSVDKQCGSEFNHISKTAHTKGLYDYTSQMHYECGGCIKKADSDLGPGCGEQVTDGLSTLDADHINELYNCGGCFRHRWIPIQDLTKEHFQNLPNFSYRNYSNGNVYPCRAFFRNQIAVGSYEKGGQVCLIAWGHRMHKVNSNFEVLTIPGGLKTQDSEYTLVEGNADMRNFELDEVFDNAVISGRLFHLNQAKGGGLGYVAYASIDNIIKSGQCPSNQLFTNSLVVGKLFRNVLDGSDLWPFVAEFPLCFKGVQLLKASVLVCKSYTRPELAGSIHQDMYRNWKLKHMKVIKKNMDNGTRITITGVVHKNAGEFCIQLAEQTGAGRIVLNIRSNFTRNNGDGLNLVLSSLAEEGWKEPKHIEIQNVFEFKPGNMFKLTIKCGVSGFKIALNNLFLANFAHQLDKVLANFVLVYGDISVNYVDIDFPPGK